MKYLAILLPMSLLLSTEILAQSPALVDHGATLFISEGTVIKINGDFSNQAGSQLTNAGTIHLAGNLVNQVTDASAGKFVFEGTSPQSISGQMLQMVNLVVNNASGITANAPVKVSNQVSFIKGHFNNSQGENALTFLSSASISNSFLPSDDSHVNGFVIKEGIGEFDFPTGDGFRFQPISVDLKSNSTGVLAKYETGDAGPGEFTDTGTNSTPLISRNRKEYWNMSALGAAIGTVSIFWDDYNNEGIGEISDLAVAHRTNEGWQNEGANDAVGNVNQGYIKSNTLNSWNPFTLGSIALRAPLPVRLISFQGKLEERYARLSWTVTDADRFSHFEVEGSTDGSRFAQIGEVKYDGSDHFASIDPSYFLPGQTRYYRLKMVDLDGAYAFSRILSIQSGSALQSVFAFPNPADKGIRFRIAAASDVKKAVAIVVSKGGEVLLQQPVTLAKGEGVLSIASLPTGSYILSIRWESGVEYLKFVKY